MSGSGRGRPHPHPPGHSVMTWGLPLDEENLETAVRLDVTCHFTLEDRGPSTFDFELPVEAIPRGSDLESFEAGLRLNERTGSIVYKNPVARGAERALEADRPALAGLLLDHLDRLDRRAVDAGEDVLPEPDDASLPFDAYHDALLSLRRLFPTPTPEIVARLLCLRAARLPNEVRDAGTVWRDTLFRAALASGEPAAARLAARLSYRLTRLVPEEELRRQQARRQLQQILDGMTMEKRATFVLFELEGMKADAIAELMGVPVGTVHSRLHGARKHFARALQREQSGSRRQHG